MSTTDEGDSFWAGCLMSFLFIVVITGTFFLGRCSV
jgi:hypothetical protein